MAHMTKKKINPINLLASNDDLISKAKATLASYDACSISANELHSLIETAHLIKSEKNAHRLLTALQRARQS